MHKSEELSQRIEDCRELYLKYGGQNHELIEKEMRDRGYHDFHRRSLYRRFERGTCKSGWIDTYGWNHLLKKPKKNSAAETQSRAGENPNAAKLMEESTGETKTPQASLTNVNSSPRPGVPAVQAMPDFDEFKNWLKRTWPEMKWEWKHQVLIYKYLKRVNDGDCTRLMIFLPPRHGKSELVTVRYPAWVLRQDPSVNIIVGSYNQRLANRFSRKIRCALADDDFQRKEQDSIPSFDTGEAYGERSYRETAERDSSMCGSLGQRPSPESSSGPGFAYRRANSEAEWETPEGGGVRAVGVGAGVTGYGAQLIIVDDPVKSRAEAESETFRERVWDWFNDDLYTRLEPGGKIILIQTRWHEDDLAGRLLREAAEEGGEQWEVISLPALAESNCTAATQRREEDRALHEADSELSDLHDEDDDSDLLPPRLSGSAVLLSNDPLGRAPGEALCPERFDEEALGRLKRKLGSYSFAALYQQWPVPADGGLFKRAWFRIVNAAPPNLKWKRGYDLGISKNSAADYTASLRVAFGSDGNMYIEGGFRRRIEYPEQKRYILGRIAAESDTEHGIELSANGNAVVQDLRSDTQARGRALRGVKVKGDKVTNALPWIAMAEEGRVFLVRGAWNSEFIDEAASFPSGTHDDQIDAVSIAVRMHRERSGRLYLFD